MLDQKQTMRIFSFFFFKAKTETKEKKLESFERTRCVQSLHYLKEFFDNCMYHMILFVYN